MKFGKKIRSLRKASGQTLKEVADKVDIAISYLSDIENEKKNASVDTLMKIASALGVNLAELFDSGETYPGAENAPDWREAGERPDYVILAANRTDGYDEELPAEAREELKIFVEYLKVKYKKKDENK